MRLLPLLFIALFFTGCVHPGYQFGPKTEAYQAEFAMAYSALEKEASAAGPVRLVQDPDAWMGIAYNAYDPLSGKGSTVGISTDTLTAIDAMYCGNLGDPCAATVFVIAHELGHHIQRGALVGSDRKHSEWVSDFYGGCALARLDMDPAPALLFIDRELGSDDPDYDSRGKKYPGKRGRLKAFDTGFKACSN